MTVGSHTLPNQGKSDNWITPKHILDALGVFDLDPCACKPQPWPTAVVQWTVGGLDQLWHGRVWLNPPYGPATGTWLKQLAAHGRGTALIFARTETRFFHRHIWPKATAILFLAGRLFFHYPDGTRAPHNSGGPSCLVAYGISDAHALDNCGLPGHLVFLR